MRSVIDYMLFSCSPVMVGGLGKWCEEGCNKTTCCLVAVL